MHPAVGLRPVEVKQRTGEVKRGIALDVKQDVDEFVFDARKSRLTPPAHRPLSRLLATTGDGRFGKGLSKRGLERREGFVI
ncbi:hypothetical protein [Nodosilinea sp. LEGE 06152]|uniref:hypothetical protein n=1 Tax=Nodosilinea sp. LEGE 06152 TaxID=2777966 RepID=UPI0032421D65